jgi:two-component system, cell cycle sensor histidine kinase and response regulator CckA
MVIRNLIGFALGRKNFNVIEAADGVAPLDLSCAFEGEIGLLLTDIDMPGMDRTALSDKILAEGDGIRVLQMSGGSLEGGLNSSVPFPFLQKPFAVKTLHRKSGKFWASP